MSDIKPSTVCPNCGRDVEPGFRFCDSCGQKLDVDVPKPEQPDEAPAWHVPIEDTSKTPILERLRQRRESRSDEDDELFAPPKKEEEPKKDETPPKDEPDTGPIAPLPAPAPPPPAREPVTTPITPKPAEAPKVAASTTTTTWRPIVREEPKTQAFGPRVALVWLLHVVIAFGCGLLLLLIAGAVASLLSNGRTALLELRGLPIFLAGATSVIVFTLLRTGKVRLSASRNLTAITVIAGFVLLVGGSAFAYRPSMMHSVQTRLDRTLRVYGPTEKEAVEGFESDVSDWNNERDHYRSDILAPVLGSKPDVNRFRFDASASEETMNGIVDRMGTHAATANNLRVRDALKGLASIYDDQMSGINLLTRGVLSGDQALIAQGDTRYKDAQKRAVQYFDLRVKPLLDRAGIDSSNFASVVSG